MNKMLIAGVAVVLLAVTAYFGAGMLAGGAGAEGTIVATGGGASGQSADPNQPERTAEVKGTVVSMDGTSVVVDRLIVDASQELTEAEKEAKRAERQAMTMEERQAAKAAEQEGLATERVTVEVPLGVAITRMVQENDNSVAKEGALSDIKVGGTVTIWTDGGTDGGVAEYVKIQAGY